MTSVLQCHVLVRSTGKALQLRNYVRKCAPVSARACEYQAQLQPGERAPGTLEVNFKNAGRVRQMSRVGSLLVSLEVFC